MTKVTGWDNGLSQDYDKGLGRWFANRLGARQQLRQDFEMTQHITQEQATQIAAQFAEDATYEFNIANAAIQIQRSEVMTQEQLIEFLKENLRLDTETKSVYVGGYDGEMYKDVTTIELVMCGEVISKVST